MTGLQLSIMRLCIALEISNERNRITWNHAPFNCNVQSSAITLASTSSRARQSSMKWSGDSPNLHCFAPMSQITAWSKSTSGPITENIVLSIWMMFCPWMRMAILCSPQGLMSWSTSKPNILLIIGSILNKLDQITEKMSENRAIIGFCKDFLRYTMTYSNKVSIPSFSSNPSRCREISQLLMTSIIVTKLSCNSFVIIGSKGRSIGIGGVWISSIAKSCKVRRCKTQVGLLWIVGDRFCEQLERGNHLLLWPGN